MRAVKEHIEEINRLYKAINKTESQYLKNDYSRKIYSMKAELEMYCKYRNYNYKEVSKLIKC